jgi:hypothetical protein
MRFAALTLVAIPTGLYLLSGSRERIVSTKLAEDDTSRTL